MTQENIVEFDVQDILPIGLTLAVTGIALAYGLEVTGDIRDDTCSTDGGFAVGGRCQVDATNVSQGYIETTQFNATTNTITGVGKFPAKFGLIATVIVAAIVLGVVVRYLGGFAAR